MPRKYLKDGNIVWSEGCKLTWNAGSKKYEFYEHIGRVVYEDEDVQYDQDGRAYIGEHSKEDE